jgi:hypothetical protein
MFSWFKKKLRPSLPDGQQYVDETDGGKLYLAMMKRCPECKRGPVKYFEGPHGGACVNIFCGYCGQGYNITPMVEVAEKIHRDEKYIEKAT